MPQTSRVQMTIPADFGSVDQARSALARACREAFPLEEEAVSDLCIAASEAMNNAVEHSGSPTLELELSTGAEGLRFTLATSGAPFDPTGEARMPEPDESGELPEGGYGLALIQACIDRMEYRHRDGKNVLTLVKNVKGGG